MNLQISKWSQNQTQFLSKLNRRDAQSNYISANGGRLCDAANFALVLRQVAGTRQRTLFNRFSSNQFV